MQSIPSTLLSEKRKNNVAELQTVAIPSSYSCTQTQAPRKALKERMYADAQTQTSRYDFALSSLTELELEGGTYDIGTMDVAFAARARSSDMQVIDELFDQSSLATNKFKQKLQSRCHACDQMVGVVQEHEARKEVEGQFRKSRKEKLKNGIKKLAVFVKSW